MCLRNLFFANCTYWVAHYSFTPDEIATRFSHRLVLIHPFPNGDGRHSRIAADLLLTSLGRERFSWGQTVNLVDASVARRRYTWGIKTDARWLGKPITYWADFATVADETAVIDLPFANFLPRFRGTTLDGPALNTHQIAEFALYQYDKTDGPFTIRLLSVEAYEGVAGQAGIR